MGTNSIITVSPQNHTFVTITTNLTRELPSIGKLSSSKWQIQVLQNSNFGLETWIALLATNTVSCFPSSVSSLHSLSKKYLPNTQVWIMIVCLSIVLSSKNSVTGKQQLVYGSNNCSSTFPPDNHGSSICRSVSCELPFHHIEYQKDKYPRTGI